MELDRRKFMGGALALLATGIAVPAGGLASATASPTRDAAPRASRFPGDPGSGRLYYGAAVWANLSLPDLERQLGGPLTVRRSYFGAGETSGLLRRVSEDHSVGRYPFVSTKVPGTWADVAAGVYDTWLRTLLSGLGSMSRPVMLVLHHEPEDNASGTAFSPAAWVRMQNHAISMASTIAPNTTIVPVLMQWTFDPRSGRRPQDWLVPNARVFGLDVYNDWAPANVGIPWRTFGEKASLALPYANGKPVAIAEYGCHTDASQPGRAAAWMRDAFAFASSHNIVAMSYYDSSLHSKWGSWVLDSERIGAMRECYQRSNVARLG